MIQVWYHKDCNDGFGAAWAAHCYFSSLNPEPLVEYIPLYYDTPMPAVTLGDTVFMVDYCRKAEEIRHLLSIGAKVVILDHHESAWATIHELAGTKGFTYSYSMDHSGAVVTWKHFFPDAMVPLLLDYIEDRDIWKFAFGKDKTNAVFHALQLVPYSFELWDEYNSEDGIRDLILDGMPIVAYDRAVVESICRDAVLTQFAGHDEIPMVNTTYNRSDVCNRLLEIYPNAPYAVYWFVRGKALQVGMRSRGAVNVAEIAKQYGGGGHHNAAAFDMVFAEVGDTCKDGEFCLFGHG